MLPMETPAIKSIFIFSLSSTRKTPIAANPLAPPPEIASRHRFQNYYWPPIAFLLDLGVV